MKSQASYAERQYARIRFRAVGITLGLYVLAFAVGIVLGILNPKEEDFSNTTVVLNLAGPTTPDLGLGAVNPSDKGEEKPLPEPPAPPKAADEKAAMEAPKVESVAKPVEKTSPEPAPAAASTAPTPVPDAITPSTANTPGAAAAAPAAAPEPVEPWVPGERGPGSRISSTNSAVLVPGQGEVPLSQGNYVTIRKSEKGNSVETTLGGSQGTVGHNIYVPVYYGMPLPKEISKATFDAIPDLVMPPNTVLYTAAARKRAVLQYYEYDGLSYRLKSDVALDQREPLWQILEDAGYDAAKADYKQNRSLMPVVIGFTVTKDNQLKGVEILQSSGDSEIDRSVLYAFKRETFWNKTGETVPGRFTYRF